MAAHKVAWHPLKAPHDAGRRIAEAFGEAGWEVACLPGEPAELNAIYGILHGGRDLIRECEERKRGYLYVDHGYFRRSSSVSAMDGYYRVVRDSLQHMIEPKVTAAGRQRWDKLGIALEPKRADGDAILLFPPSEHQARFHGIDRAKWIEVWKADLELQHRMDVILCEKGDGNAEIYLDRAYRAVGFNSTAMLDLAAKGVPVDALGPSPLFWLPSWMPKRQWESRRFDLFCSLAERQFTVAEIKRGMAG